MDEPLAAVVWDPRFLAYDLGPEHPFSERSRGLAVDLLATRAEAVGARVHWIRPVAPLDRAGLERFHDAAYVDLVQRVSGQESEVFLDAGDTPSFPGCFEEAARIAAGAERSLDWARAHRRPAFHPAGGLHHAHPDRASGFCIFNDVALAVRHALDQGQRVAYLDVDAHHGDGVMYGFYDSGRVLDVDFHQDGRTLFPGTGFPNEIGRGDGAGLKANLPLPPGAGDDLLLSLFRRVVPPLFRAFRPEVIVVQHGVDGHVGDRLAGLQFTSVAYDEIDRTVLALARELGDPALVVTGGGGYRPDAVARVLARAGLALAGGALPDLATTLPEDWRERYRQELGAPAPIAWGDDEPPAGTPAASRFEERLIEQLERGLGTRFPAVR